MFLYNTIVEHERQQHEIINMQFFPSIRRLFYTQVLKQNNNMKNKANKFEIDIFWINTLIYKCTLYFEH